MRRTQVVALKDGGNAAQQLHFLVNHLTPKLKPLLANFKDLGGIAFQRQDAIEETLVAVPWVLAFGQTPGRDEKAHFVMAVAQQPNVCRKGYISDSQWRLPSDTTPCPRAMTSAASKDRPASPAA